MGKYIPFTEEQKQRARETDLVDLLQRQGYKLKKEGKQYVWGSGSDKVSIKGNYWYHQYEQVGGDAVDFIKKFENKSYPDAVLYLLEEQGERVTMPESEEEPPKPFELPKKNSDMRRVYAYLFKKRCIDREILNTFIHYGLIYETEKYHNAVFIGFDKERKAVHAHLRATVSESSFRMNIESSNPEYSFNWKGRSNHVFVFEAPIDMLSYISDHKEGWKQHTYVASCGVGDIALNKMLEDNPQIDTIHLCRDNDGAGHKANKRTQGNFAGTKYTIQIELSKYKDWNADRMGIEETESEEEKICQVL